MLADSGKFGLVAFCRLLDLGRGQLVIADSALAIGARSALEAIGVTVMTADASEVE